MASPFNLTNAGIYNADQLAVIQSVFKEIISEPWFIESPEKQQQFAALVIKAFREGLMSREKLRKYCLTIAEQRFVSDTASIPELTYTGGTMNRLPQIRS